MGEVHCVADGGFGLVPGVGLDVRGDGDAGEGVVVGRSRGDVEVAAEEEDVVVHGGGEGGVDGVAIGVCDVGIRA